MKLVINKKTLQVEDNSTINAIEKMCDSYEDVEAFKNDFTSENLKRINLDGQNHFNAKYLSTETHEIGNKIRAVVRLSPETQLEMCIRRIGDLEEALSELSEKESV